jgi:hypothetical protein
MAFNALLGNIFLCAQTKRSYRLATIPHQSLVVVTVISRLSKSKFYYDPFRNRDRFFFFFLNYLWIVAGLLLWGTLSDEKSGM